MKRRLAPCTAGLVLGVAGCFGGGIEKGLSLRGEPVEVPIQSEASVAVAARVDQVGRQLVAQNPFLGIEPAFHTLGRTEPEIFHRDSHGVFLTEGLVQRCRTDEELAAVLASELGKMSAARRVADRMGVSDPLVAVPNTSAVNPGGIGSDMNPLGVQAVFDQQLSRRTPRKLAATDEPQQIAAAILKSAGHDPGLLKDVAPLLTEASRNTSAALQLGVRGDAPRWSR